MLFGVLAEKNLQVFKNKIVVDCKKLGKGANLDSQSVSAIPFKPTENYFMIGNKY